MDRKLVDQYAADGAGLSKMIAGLSRDELLAVPVPGTWSIQQIVLHVLDTDLEFTSRFKRVIAEEKPLLMGFDQSKFTACLHYEAQDAALAADIFAKNRQQIATLLRQLSDADFERQGVHSERGLMTLADLLGYATRHYQHHMKFVRESARSWANRFRVGFADRRRSQHQSLGQNVRGKGESPIFLPRAPKNRDSLRRVVARL